MDGQYSGAFTDSPGETRTAIQIHRWSHHPSYTLTWDLGIMLTCRSLYVNVYICPVMFCSKLYDHAEKRRWSPHSQLLLLGHCHWWWEWFINRAGIVWNCWIPVPIWYMNFNTDTKTILFIHIFIFSHNYKLFFPHLKRESKILKC